MSFALFLTANAQRRRFGFGDEPNDMFSYAFAFLSHFAIREREKLQKKIKNRRKKREEKSIKITTTAQKLLHCCTLQQLFTR